MKIGKLSILFLFLLFIPFIKADLIVNCPSSATFNAYNNYAINCSFYNNNSFSIVDVQLYNNSIASMNKISLSAGETRTNLVNLYSTDEIASNTSLSFYYYYYVNTTLTPENKNVEIYNFEFRPNILEVVQGSNVVFTNKDNYNIHSVVDSGGEFSSGDIQTNNTWSYTFNNIKNYTVRDGWIYGNFMYIRVKSSAEQILTYNKDYDKTITIFLNASYIQTTLNNIILTSNFTSEWNESQEGVLSILNNGSYVAKNIKLVGEWTSFSKNNFDLQPGQITYVNLEVIPYITAVADTNKTYIKYINISSSNTPLYEYNYSIFINYSSSVSAMTNATDWVKYFYYKKEFCELSNWTAADCRTEPLIEYVPTYNCSDMEFNLTTTVAEWQRNNYDINELRNQYELLNAELKEKDDTWNNTLVELRNMTEQNLILSNYNKKLNDNNRDMQWVIAIIFFVVVVGGYFVYDIIKVQNKKKTTDILNLYPEKYYKKNE